MVIATSDGDGNVLDHIVKLFLLSLCRTKLQYVYPPVLSCCSSCHRRTKANVAVAEIDNVVVKVE